MIKPPVLIVGSSGSGKSSSFKNLEPKKTIILNTERKPLPFREFRSFTNVGIDKYKTLDKALIKLQESTEYEYVVIDSLTSLLEIIERYCKTVFQGYTVWSEYNDMVYNVLQRIKDLPQQVFVTCIDEIVETPSGELKSVAKVKGKEWKASIEKEFAIVMHTKIVEEDDETTYNFKTRPNNKDSTKSPAGLFDSVLIPNDAKYVADKIDEYYNS